MANLQVIRASVRSASNHSRLYVLGVALILGAYLAIGEVRGQTEESVPHLNSPQATAPTKINEEPVRVMSFNLRFSTANDGENHWRHRRDFLTETIQAFAPDLLGTQETLLEQKKFLDQKLIGYQSVGVGRDDGGDAGEMTAIWFRTDRFELLDSGHFWLSEEPDRPGSVSWDSSLTRMATWLKLRDRKSSSNHQLFVINTHFDHIGKQARIESAKMIRERIKMLGSGCSIIVTGDFNAGDNEPPYAELFGQVSQADANDAWPLIDTFRVINPTRGENEGTFSGFRPDRTSGARIDWIGVSPHWEIVDAAIDRTARDGRTPSDHFPVTATIRKKSALPADEADSDILTRGPFNVKRISGIPYWDGDDFDDRKHRLDLYLPEGIERFPVLMFIHGGAWRNGDRSLYRAVGVTFARNGIGTAVISYRLSPQVKHPGHITDCARAFAWIKGNIEQHGGNSEQIFVAGQSAGGHLTALLATNEKYLAEHDCSISDICGAIPISGVYQFRGAWNDNIIGTERIAKIDASPLDHIHGNHPPFLIMYAESDLPSCDIASQRLCNLLEEKKIVASVHEIAARNHVTIMLNLMTSERDPATQKMLKFIWEQCGN